MVEAALPQKKKPRLQGVVESLLEVLKVPDLEKLQGDSISKASVVIPVDGSVEEITTDITIGNSKDILFLMGMQKEAMGDDRILIAITKDPDLVPVLYFRPETEFLSRLPGRTRHFWKARDLDDPQVRKLTDPKTQLYEIRRDILPHELRNVKDLSVQSIIDRAIQAGCTIWVSNQGSWKRGPLPVPAWFRKKDKG